MSEESTFNIIIHREEVSIDHQLLRLDSFDNMVIETPQFYFVLEGLILNKKKLISQYATSDFKSLLHKLISEVGIDILKIIEGEIRGILWMKKEQKIFVFTNHTATQRMFYYHQNDFFAASNSLVDLVKVLRSEKQPVVPNTEGMFQLLALGVMLEDGTPVQNVFKVLDGNHVTYAYDYATLTTEVYYSAFNQQTSQRSKRKILEAFEDHFSEAVEMEYGLDENKDSISFLSGGLDSRSAVFKALEKGFIVNNIFCFSDSGYRDHHISSEIARAYQLPYFFQPLDGGAFLKSIDHSTCLSEGTSLYTGCIHSNFAIQNNFKDRRNILFHSGTLGGEVLGDLLSSTKKTPPNLKRFAVYGEPLSQIETSLMPILKKYETEEAFATRNIGFNIRVGGQQAAKQAGIQTSPFMSKDFMSFAFSVAPGYKRYRQMYHDWMQQYCHDATKFIWDYTGYKPTNNRIAILLTNRVRYMKEVYHTHVNKNARNFGMAPYQTYFHNSSSIRTYYDAYFSENIKRLGDYSTLRRNLIQLFNTESFAAKARAINVLSILKLYFPE